MPQGGQKSAPDLIGGARSGASLLASLSRAVARRDEQGGHTRARLTILEKQRGRPNGRSRDQFRDARYFEMRNCDRLEPMAVKTAPICDDDVTLKNFPVSVAQFFRICEVGSPSVLTWMV